MIPKFQCPNCNQFELGFTLYNKGKSFDHQERPMVVAVKGHKEQIKCGAFDCGYTGKPEEFVVIPE